jgi:crossover junction endodeoxyribonuclease RuvC
MNVLAVDPGLNGAAAVLDSAGGIIDCFDLPTIGEGTQRRIDAANLADLIRAHAPYTFAMVELVNSWPKQGVASTFRFGASYGTILGVICALAIPLRHVSPAQWKRAMRLNNEAETSRMRAIDQWPGKAGFFARKRDHNRAEAALLGLYSLKNGVV